jgi:hypothetical protein
LLRPKSSAGRLAAPDALNIDLLGRHDMQCEHGDEARAELIDNEIVEQPAAAHLAGPMATMEAHLPRRIDS